MAQITKDTGIIEAVQKYPQIIEIFQQYGLGYIVISTLDCNCRMCVDKIVMLFKCLFYSPCSILFIAEISAEV